MENTAPCMAIVEKKGRRTGGCMNVFFQVFEWNRNLSKKNLFSKKLLLPGEEQVSKRLGKKEKMPKPVIHLIADGSTGGFPSVKKKKKKKKKEGGDHFNVEPQHDTRSPGLVARLMGLESMPASAGQNQKLDEHVSRGDKPLKEMVSDRQSVAGFGEEGLRLKDVLSRPRRHPKLPSQLKSPCGITRNHNSSRTSRLMDVATRILEPGLQPKNRAKYTLTFSDASYLSRTHSDASHLSRSRLKASKTTVVPPDSEKGSFVGKRLVGEQRLEWPASASNLVSVSSLHSREKNEVKPISTFIRNVERNRLRTQDKVSNAVGLRTMVGAIGSSNSKSRRVSPSSSANSLGEAEDLIATNWRLSGQTGRTRHPSRMSRPEFELERRSCRRQDDYLSLSRSPAKRQRNEGQKSRFPNSGAAGSQLNKKEDVKGVTVCEEEADRKLCPRNRQPGRRNKNVDTSGSATGERTKETSKVRDEKGGKLYLGKRMALNGDALGALLDRTLKELTCEGEEETNGIGKAKRSTAVILQDLISALTTEQLVNKNESEPDTEITFQSEAENEADVTDSATTVKNSNFPDYGTVADLKDRVTRMLIEMNEAGIRLKGGQLTRAQDVILSTELLSSDSTCSVAGSSLLDQLAVLGSRNWRPVDCLPGFEEFSRQFFFDTVIESLDSRYSMCGYSGIRPRRKFSSDINLESLFREETGRWTKLAGKSADEIIEWEMMNCSFGKWSDFDAEVFETGVETSSDILQGLLDEFVTDLWISQHPF